jgi:two-component system, LytTR family, sensor kinase
MEQELPHWLGASNDMTEAVPQRGERQRYFLVSVWLVWTVLAILSFARHSFVDSHLGWNRRSWHDLLAWFACFYPWALLTPPIFWLERRFSLTGEFWKRSLGPLFLASFVFSYLGFQLDIVLNFLLDWAFGLHPSASRFLVRATIVELAFGQFFFWCTWATGWALRTFAQYHRQARMAAQLSLEKAQLEASLRTAELESLRMRLNPHFLFNTLQNISVLTQHDPKVATQMLTRLGDLLRTALRRDVPAETTVKDEIALTRDYLAVERMRFGDRLTILVNVAPAAEQALIPSFLLQPLVENAVIHGLRGASQGGTIAMQAKRAGHRLVLTVADNGRGLPDTWHSSLKTGVGLSSTQERLSRMYPGEHEFLIQRLVEGGTEVRIAIPYREKVGSEESLLREQPSAVGG